VLGILVGGYAVGSTYAQSPGAAPTTPRTTAPSTSHNKSPSAGTGPRSSPVAMPPTSSAGWGPNRVVVPALGVDAPVDPVGTIGGILVPPDDPGRLGWWRDGAGPGDRRGSVLITGHTVHTGGGAMDHLGDVAPGAVIRVQASGRWFSYRVDEVSHFLRQTLAAQADQVFDQATSPRLVLITCERWDGTAYAGNTVVVAEPVGG